jgi:hypothetical protein
MQGTPSEQLARIQDKDAKNKAKAKALGMRIVEGGTFAVASVGIQALYAKKPELMAFGPRNKLSLDGIALGLGTLGLFFGKGTMQDIGSGLFYAGLGPVLRNATQKALTS